jgi:putative transposase
MMGRNELSAIDPADWQLAKKRERVLRSLIARGERLKAGELAEAAAALGVSDRWLRKLLERFRREPRISTLLPDPGGRPRGHATLSPAVETIVSDQIANFYATAERPSLMELVDAIHRACRQAGLPLPTRKTISRRVRNADPKTLVTKREGRKAARDRYGAVEAHFVPSDRPLGLIQIDHTRVDLIVVDEVYREPIGRPWLTMAIDVFSRIVVGYYLTLEAPSSLSVSMCMTHVCLDKGPWLAERGIDAEWPGGLPEAIHLDNAAEFHAEALVRGCEEHGIIINYRPVATPHYGGHIERLIGTTMGEVHLLPGTTFSNVAEKGKYDSAKAASLTVAELDLWLARQIAVLYHGSPHRGLDERTPLGVWREAVEAGAHPRPVLYQEALRLDFLPFELRRPRRDGIELFRLSYWHDALPAIAARSDVKLPVRYDPRDMSRVWLRPPGQQEMIMLRLKDLRRPSVTLWEWRAAGKRLRALGRQEVDEEAQFAAVEANRQLVNDAKLKTSQRQAQRIRDARRATAAGDVRVPVAPAPIDYSKPPRIYDVEEW